jgi:type IV pilus assembly protein PilB
MITATLEAVIAQRLVRRICQACKRSFAPDDELLRELGPAGPGLRQSAFYYGQGCAECHHTGYRGRRGIFEILRVGPELRRLVLEGGSTAEIRRAAIAGGMRTLRESGLAAVAEGHTTVDEVLRETSA